MNRRPDFVGPHEGQELDLMIAGLKPMSMFLETIDSEFEFFDEEKFDQIVSQKNIVKRVIIEGDRQNSIMKRTFYALPNEEWRIDSFLLVQKIDNTSGCHSGWRPDLERVIGSLLGYQQTDIESFLSWISKGRPKI